MIFQFSSRVSLIVPMSLNNTKAHVPTSHSLCYYRNASSDQHQYMARKYGPYDMEDIQINDTLIIEDSLFYV